MCSPRSTPRRRASRPVHMAYARCARARSRSSGCGPSPPRACASRVKNSWNVVGMQALPPRLHLRPETGADMELTQHTMRCPLEECSATVTVRKDPDGYSSSRHLDVTARSLRPSTSSVLPARRAHLPDATPPVSYVREADPTPYHSLPVECAKPLLGGLECRQAGCDRARSL